MRGKELLTLPNLLSLSRIAFLPALFVLAWQEMTLAFTIAYAVVGATDLFDGALARKLNQASDLGKTLDSVADLFFYLSTAYFMYFLYAEYLLPNLVLLYVFFGLLGLSFVVSSVWCKKPLLMHTFLLKACAVLVYAAMVLSYVADTTMLIAAILIVYLVAFVEEMAIFIAYGKVDADTPTIFHLMGRP
jgi:phosphatidylglycerophosphate synthase